MRRDALREFKLHFLFRIVTGIITVVVCLRICCVRVTKWKRIAMKRRVELVGEIRNSYKILVRISVKRLTGDRVIDGG
jgi:hypothetical protein